MNKKFLSVVLFSALMVGAAGTFTSCKDYDDDIDRIDTELSDLKSKLDALQTKIDAGKYITNVATTAEGITITLNDGSSYPITNGKDGAPGAAGAAGDKVEINDEGFFVINGETTEWKAVAKDASTGETIKIKTPTMSADGFWVFYDEKGEAFKTTWKVAPVVAVQNADKSWTLTVFDANGDSQTINIPTAASLLTDLVVLDPNNANLEYYAYTFAYKKLAGAPSTYDLPNRGDWKGPRALPGKDGNLVAGMKTIPVQINPTSIDATEVEFSLVDSHNNTPYALTLSASEDKTLQTGTRAAYGNGMYQMVMDDIYFDSDAITAGLYQQFGDQFKASATEKILYAVTAGGETRSAYTVAVKAATNGKALSEVQIKQGINELYPLTASEKIGNENGSKDAPAYEGINMGEWYSVAPVDAAALYDMYLWVNSDYVTLYGIELKNEAGNWQFRITKTPDTITRATFPLTVKTVDKSGNYAETIIWVKQSDALANGYEYAAINYQLKDVTSDKNRFNIDLSLMKNALGDENLALWNTKVDLSKTEVRIYDPVADESKPTVTIGTGTAVDGITPIITEKNEDGQTNTTDVPKSNYIQFRIDNTNAGTTYWALNRQYIAYVTFKTKEGNELTTTTVPFTLTIPAITTVFQLDKNFVVDGDAVCYMYEGDLNKATVGKAAFKLNRVFSKFSTNSYDVTLDNSTKVGETGRTSAQLAIVGTSTATPSTTATAAETYITLADKDALDGTTNLVNSTTGLQAGYGQSLKLSISGSFAGTWSYGDETFDFTVKVLSPIYEGTVKPRTGNAVEIPATELDGYEFGNDDIVGNTYNTAVTYNVLPDLVTNPSGNNDWNRVEIAEVLAKSSNTNVFTLDATRTTDPYKGWADPTAATDKKDGYFKLNAQNVPTTTTTNSITIQVTDIWGYVKPSTINVTITVE